MEDIANREIMWMVERIKEDRELLRIPLNRSDSSLQRRFYLDKNQEDNAKQNI